MPPGPPKMGPFVYVNLSPVVKMIWSVDRVVSASPTWPPVASARTLSASRRIDVRVSLRPPRSEQSEQQPECQASGGWLVRKTWPRRPGRGAGCLLRRRGLFFQHEPRLGPGAQAGEVLPMADHDDDRHGEGGCHRCGGVGEGRCRDW